MTTSYSRNQVMLTGLELLLAVIVFSGAFLAVVFTHRPVLERDPTGALIAHVLFATSFLLPAALLKVYRLDSRDSLSAFLARFLVSVGLGLALCYAAFALVPHAGEFRDAIPDAAALSAGVLMLTRLVLLPRLDIAPLRYRVLILGTTGEAATVADALGRIPSTGITVAGYYQTDPSCAIEVRKDRILPKGQSLEEVVTKLNIHAIVVAVREQRNGALPVDELLNCRLRGVEVLDVPGVLERVTGTVPVETLKSSWLIYGKGFAQGWGRRTVKRAFDVIMATGLLLASAPLMLLTALAIFLESGGPVIFRQERVGFGGRPFTLLKFRSMRTDAEKDGVPRWASVDDPRITFVGRIIRRTRIDELPQLFNVLRGEMSLVGPRPERAYFAAQLAERIPFYSTRHTVKPGVTGWAQVRYQYGASVEETTRKLEYDLYYVKNHSLLLDLDILFRSVKVVLLGEGAR